MRILCMAGNIEMTGMHLESKYILWLSILATSGLVVMWGVFWFYVNKSDDSILDVLTSMSFFKTVTVMGVVAATVVLSLAGRLEGDITGAILSGIVGYVLGQLKMHKDTKPDES